MNIYFIAEIGSNHNHDWQRCEQLIRTAADIGCNAVKFQYGLEKTFADGREVKDFPLEWWNVIQTVSASLGLEVGCTFLSSESVDLLECAVDFAKVGSYELSDFKLVSLVAGMRGGVFVSTGMATLWEIKGALELVGRSRVRCLMDCVSQYPSKHVGRLMKARLDALKSFGLPVGYSDHSVSDYAVECAAENGAVAIECHLDLVDGKGAEAGHSWRPEQLSDTISYLNPDWRERKWRRDPADGLRPMRWAR
jgi:sialic acid synthase SpsE